MTAGFETFGYDGIDSRLFAFAGEFRGGNHMDDRDAVRFEKACPELRISGRSKDDLDPFVHYQLHDFIELGVHQRYVDAERFVGRLPAFADMFPQCFGMHGACSQQAQSAGVAYGRGSRQPLHHTMPP